KQQWHGGTLGHGYCAFATAFSIPSSTTWAASTPLALVQICPSTGTTCWFFTTFKRRKAGDFSAAAKALSPSWLMVAINNQSCSSTAKYSWLMGELCGRPFFTTPPSVTSKP